LWRRGRINLAQNKFQWRSFENNGVSQVSVEAGVWFAAKEAPCTTQVMSLLRKELIVQTLCSVHTQWQAVDTITPIVRDYQHKKTGIQLNRNLTKIWMSSSINSTW